MGMEERIDINDPESVRQMLVCSGYSAKAVDYFIDQPNMGVLPDADQTAEITGPCGDTMRIYLKISNGVITDAKYQVLGCPGAISAAMAAVDIIRGQTVAEAMKLKDRDIFRRLEEIPEQKQHCIRLAVKTLIKALEDYQGRQKKSA